MIFRTAAEPSLLPGRVSTGAARPLALRGEARRATLTARDRSAIYGGFHLYVEAAGMSAVPSSRAAMPALMDRHLPATSAISTT